MTPAISQWLGTWPVPFTLEMAQIRIERSLDAMVRKRALIYAVEVRGNLAGWIGGAAPPDTPQGNFGYWLGEAYRGQALMQEAAPVFLASLRTQLALTSVEAFCQASNYGSAKVLAVCGLHRVGARMEYTPARNRDELVDVWQLAWNAKQPALGEASE